MIRTTYTNIKPYTTKDGSIIRELMHPDLDKNLIQSLAEATIPSRMVTKLHKHLKSEEIYHVTMGIGFLTVGSEKIKISVGDTIQIPPGTPHQIENTDQEPLKILCCCTPPYNHEDTLLLSLESPKEPNR